MVLRLALGILSLAASLALAPNASAQSGDWCTRPEGDAFPFDGSVGQGWGNSIALTDTHLLMGAPHTAQLGADTGSAYVFTLHEGQWVFQAALRPPTSHPGQVFGGAVALSGDTAFVTAEGDETSGIPRGGAVYVFERRGAKWSFVQKLTPRNSTPQTSLGSSVAADGDRLVVGSRFDARRGPGAGSASIFQRAPQGPWTWEDVLFGNDTVAGDNFGTAVDVEGDLVVVSSAYESPLWAGSVYAFVRQSGTWQQEIKLRPLGPPNGYGSALALSEGWLLVGDPTHPNPSGVQSAMGAVFTYRRRAGVWREKPKLQPIGFDSGRFGTALDLRGETAVIAAPLALLPRVYTFQRSGGAWSETKHWSGPAGSQLGKAVALTGDRIAAGAPALNPQGLLVGGARSFLRVDPVTSYCTAKVDSLGCAPSTSFVGEPSVSKSGPLEFRASSVQSGRTGLVLYGLNGRAALPFQGGTLCVAGPRSRTPLQSSGGNPPPADCSGSLAFDFRPLALSDAATFSPGTTVNAQAWYRDPGGVLPFGLSDAVEFGLCP